LVLAWLRHLKDSLQRTVDVRATEIRAEFLDLVESSLEGFVVVFDAPFAFEQELEVGSVADDLERRSKWETLDEKLEGLAGKHYSVIHRTTTIDQEDILVQLRFLNRLIFLHLLVSLRLLLSLDSCLVLDGGVEVDPSRHKCLRDYILLECLDVYLL